MVVGIMNSTAFSLLASSNPQVNEIHIPFGTIDFQPHQSIFAQVFESMDQDMDLTIGTLNFRVGSLGLIRLSDPMKPDSSASEHETIAMSESSEGSSIKVNSPVSLTEVEEGKITGGDCRCSGYRGIPVHLLLGPVIGPSSAQGRTNDPSYGEDPHEEASHEENDGGNC
jgi:hypothetical protein